MLVRASLAYPDPAPTSSTFNIRLLVSEEQWQYESFGLFPIGSTIFRGHTIVDTRRSLRVVKFKRVLTRAETLGQKAAR